MNGSSIGFYVGFNFDTAERGRASRDTTPPPPAQRYHDTTPVKPMDYSFGTSPSSSAGSYLQSRAPSPTKSPKQASKKSYAQVVIEPPPPPPPEQLTARQQADRALAVKLWGAPWRPEYEALVAQYYALFREGDRKQQQ